MFKFVKLSTMASITVAFTIAVTQWAGGVAIDVSHSIAESDVSYIDNGQWLNFDDVINPFLDMVNGDDKDVEYDRFG